jgi:hypothetical protein
MKKRDEEADNFSAKIVPYSGWHLWSESSAKSVSQNCSRALRFARKYRARKLLEFGDGRYLTANKTSAAETVAAVKTTAAIPAIQSNSIAPNYRAGKNAARATRQ